VSQVSSPPSSKAYCTEETELGEERRLAVRQEVNQLLRADFIRPIIPLLHEDG